MHPHPAIAVAPSVLVRTFKDSVAGAGVLTGGHLTAQGLALLRHVIIARLLSPTDMGIAALFPLVWYFLDLASQLSINQHIVQSDRGDDPRFQRVAHTISIVRGALMGLIILASAYPAAALLDVQHAAWAFAIVALVPVFRGFMHLDSKRYQRSLRFGPDVAIEAGSQIIITLLAWPMAVWIGTYAAVAWLLLAKSVADLMLSHIVATRRYELGWDRTTVIGFLSFGWPLALNGMLLFAVSYVDQFAIGVMYSVEQMGLFAVAVTVAVTPIVVVSKLLRTYHLPILASAKDNPAEFHAAVRRLTWRTGTCAVFYAAALTAAPHAVVTTLFGTPYAEAAILLAWLGIMQALRLIRLIPVTSSIALGDTRNPMFANVARAACLLLLPVIPIIDAPVHAVLVLGCLGELAALAVSSRRFAERLRRTPWAQQGVASADAT